MLRRIVNNFISSLKGFRRRGCVGDFSVISNWWCICMISVSKVELGRENKDDEKYKRLSMFFKRIKKLLESESLGIFKWVVLERNLFWFM